MDTEDVLSGCLMFILYSILFCVAAVVGGYLFHIGWNLYQG